MKKKIKLSTDKYCLKTINLSSVISIFLFYVINIIVYLLFVYINKIYAFKNNIFSNNKTLNNFKKLKS